MKKLIITMFALVSLWGCKRDAFRTESEWTAPLLHTNLNLGNLLADSMVKVNSDQTTDFVFNREYDLVSMEDLLAIPDHIDSLEVTLSSLVLDDRSFIDTLTLAEIYPQIALFNGQTMDLPAQDITNSQGVELDMTEEFFTTATFVDGTIDITIYNDLPVEAELLQFALLNQDDQSQVLAGTVNNLLPFDSTSLSFSLAGKTVDGLLELKVSRIKTKASAGPVLIEANKGLRTHFKVSNLKPQSATAIFPEQDLVDQEDENPYDFGGAELTRVVVKSGSIYLNVSSTLEETIILDYTIPNSSKPGQVGPISKQFIIPAATNGNASSLREVVAIDGFDILLGGKDVVSAPLVNHIYTTLKARIQYSGIERSLSLQDKVSIEFGLVDIVPDLIVGDPGYHVLPTTEDIDIDILKNLEGQISLEDAVFDIELENTFGIEAIIDINALTGHNSRTYTAVNLSSPTLINAINIGRATNMNSVNPFTWSTTLDKTNSNIKPFLENLPDRITPNITAFIRPYGTVNYSDFALGQSRLKANMSLRIPFRMQFNNVRLETVQPVDLFKSEESYNIKGGNLNLLVSNDFPLEGTVVLEFIDDNDFVLATLFGETGNLIAAAVIDPLTERTMEPAESTLTTTIDASEVEALRSATKVRIRTLFNTPSGMRHPFFDDYSIDMKLVADVIYETAL